MEYESMKKAQMILSCVFLIIILFSCGSSREDSIDINPIETLNERDPLELSQDHLTGGPSLEPTPKITPETTTETTPETITMTQENGETSAISPDHTETSNENAIPSGDWALILINSTHYLPEDFSVILADFETGKVDARIADTCKRMFTHAQKDGISLQLVDAYRTYDRQNYLYQKKVKSYIEKGYSQADAENEAATVTARPNTSEHQTGLALDIVTSSYRVMDKGFADTKAFQWLNEHAHEYGFILRYPENKKSITGVIYEPWHWRFVGVEAASYMKESGQCLEEYLDEIHSVTD